MINTLLQTRRAVDGREVREPTLLALGLTVAGFLLLLAVLGGMVFVTAGFGLAWRLVAALGLLASLVLVPRLWRRKSTAPVTGRQRWLGRLRGAARTTVVVVVAGWLGLIAWSGLSRGGPMPSPKAEPDSVRVLTWNILRGADHGPPWQQNDWPARKQGLAEALRHVQPDLLLVQEALPGQLAFLDRTLPGHRRVGVGRDDGAAGGEHCAIYFNEDRFRQLDGGTFWLEAPTDRPRGPGPNVKRICTWVRLRDQPSGRTLRVYNTHQYLTAGAQQPASAIILDHIKAGDPSDAVLLAGDFNATPDAPSRRVFARAGLRETALLAGRGAEGTYQFSGLRLRCLDGILVGPGWRLHRYTVVNVKPCGVFPSDHFGVMADLLLEVPDDATRVDIPGGCPGVGGHGR
jgi:endonuclease/exonuclease/phosphatase family metal-dependent hydrolase